MYYAYDFAVMTKHRHKVSYLWLEDERHRNRLISYHSYPTTGQVAVIARSIWIQEASSCNLGRKPVTLTTFLFFVRIFSHEQGQKDKLHHRLLQIFYTFYTNSVALSPKANYTDWSTATCRRNLVPTFVDREVSRGQRGGSLRSVISVL
jgi:hypothetical protein